MSVDLNKSVIGRFAPSPTGLMHFGSLVTAVASFCSAKSSGGLWLVRMEDLDAPRNVPGAASAILRQLEALNLCWDEAVVYQSDRKEFYADTLHALINKGVAYRCTCTRRDINAQAPYVTASGPVYSGKCRHSAHPATKHGSWRLEVENRDIIFTDLIHGEFEHNPAKTCGDFILKRTDDIFAYQFATPLDDAEQRVTQVVRGRDLLDSTARQIYLLQELSRTSPVYAHIPLALDNKGNKISKSMQNKPVIRPSDPLPFTSRDMARALVFLNQLVPEWLFECPAKVILDWGIEHFTVERIPLQDIPAGTI